MLKPDIVALGLRDQRLPDHLLRRRRVLPGLLPDDLRLQPVEGQRARQLDLGLRRRRLLVIGFLSDKVRVRKPFMVVGAIGAIVFTIDLR